MGDPPTYPVYLAQVEDRQRALFGRPLGGVPVRPRARVPALQSGPRPNTATVHKTPGMLAADKAKAGRERIRPQVSFA